MPTAVASYCIAVGALMVGWWGVDLSRGAWRRGDRAHAELVLHLAAEFVTAAALIAAGIVDLSAGADADRWLAVALGMLLYTTIASPGYFVARREWPVVGLFAVLATLTLVSLVVVLT